MIFHTKGDAIMEELPSKTQPYFVSFCFHVRKPGQASPGGAAAEAERRAPDDGPG